MAGGLRALPGSGFQCGACLIPRRALAGFITGSLAASGLYTFLGSSGAPPLGVTGKHPLELGIEIMQLGKPLHGR